MLCLAVTSFLEIHNTYTHTCNNTQHIHAFCINTQHIHAHKICCLLCLYVLRIVTCMCCVLLRVCVVYCYKICGLYVLCMCCVLLHNLMYVLLQNLYCACMCCVLLRVCCVTKSVVCVVYCYKICGLLCMYVLCTVTCLLCIVAIHKKYMHFDTQNLLSIVTCVYIYISYLQEIRDYRVAKTYRTLYFEGHFP